MGSGGYTLAQRQCGLKPAGEVYSRLSEPTDIIFISHDGSVTAVPLRTAPANVVLPMGYSI